MGTGEDKEPMDVEGVLEHLRAALPLQYRSALAYTVAAGSLTGLQHAPLGVVLWEFAQRDLEDARRLVEKVVALGGSPPTHVADVLHHPAGDEAIDWLIEVEEEVVERLQDVIPSTGQTGASEALEHRLEHIIMRKQEQIDTLLRARGR
jgi:bacterioferritin (cytochrome b1)